MLGIASPNYKTGRYSKFLPARLAAGYEAARQDSRLLELSDEIALIDARLGHLVSALDTGESVWGDLLLAYGRLRGAMNRQDKGAITQTLSEVDRLITRGGDEAAAWEQIGVVLEQRRRLVESERKRLVEMQQMISSERAMALLGAVVNIIKEHVDDRAVLAAISSGINNLIIAEP